MIKIENLSKTFLVPHEKRFNIKDYFIHFFSKMNYEKFNALNDISFNMEKGEGLGIIGSNGAGKSTLLKILAGIYSPDSGKIVIKGNVVPFLELGVGFHSELSARDNIYLNGLLLGIPRKKIQEKFDEIIDFAEIRPFVDQKLKNFSSGMQARLGFAIAMHAPADVFLIDEILAVGDYAFQQKSLNTFKNKLKDKTIVFVSHDMNKIKENCNRVMWIADGRIKEIGNPEKVIANYIISEQRV